MPNPVYPSDLADRWRPLTATEEPVAQALLDDAWAILSQQLPDIEDRLTAGSLSELLVVAVESAMVLRVLRNPNGVRQWSVDDYSETRDSALSAGALYLSPEELDLLSGRSKVRRSRAFSVQPSRGPCPAPGAEIAYAQQAYERWGYSYGYGAGPPL